MSISLRILYQWAYKNILDSLHCKVFIEHLLHNNHHYDYNTSCTILKSTPGGQLRWDADSEIST